MNKQLWLTWETQRRNAELARAFGAEYGHFDYSKHPRALRYLLSAIATFRALLRTQPEVVFTQCPSIVLTLFVTMLRPFFRYRVVIDAHNSAVEHLTHDSAPVRALHRAVFRRADMVIVSNARLTPRLGGIAARVATLPDRLPGLHAGSGAPQALQKAVPNIMLISTFKADEPIAEVIEAVNSLDKEVVLHITGRKSRAGEFLQKESRRIRFTGFLPESEYEALLASSDLAIDLTTLPDCLVCGAYESLAAGTPALLTDSAVNRETFESGFLYCSNTADSIKKALEDFLRDPPRYRKESAQYRATFTGRWDDAFREVQSTVASLGMTHGAPPPPDTGESQASAATAKMKSGVMWLAGSTMLWQVISWGLTLLTARYLTPHDYGLLALAETINPYLVMVASLRIDSWLIQKKNVKESEEKTIFSLALCLGTSTMLAGMLLAPVVANFYDSPQMSLPFQLIAIVFFFRGLQLIPDARLKRNMRFKSIALMNLFVGISRGVLQVVLAYNGWSYWALVVGNIYGELAITIWMITAAGLPKGLSWNNSVIKEAVKFGLAVTGSSIFWIIFTTSDNAIVGKLFGTEVLGYYAFAFYLMELPLSKLNAIVAPVLVPFFVQVREDLSVLRDTFLALTRAVLFFISPVLLGLASVTEDFVPIVFGEQWRPLIGTLQIFCFVGLLRASSGNVSSLVVAINKPNRLFRVFAFTALILAPSFYVSGKFFGLYGIFGVWLAIYPLVSLLPLALVLQEEIQLSISRNVLNTVVPFTAAGMMAAATWMLSNAMNGHVDPIPKLVILILFGAAVYGALIATVFRRSFTEAVRVAPRRTAS